jgi:hypothetical protein
MKYGTERKDNIQTMKKLSEQGRIIREGGKCFGYRGRCLSFCDGIFPFFMESKKQEKRHFFDKKWTVHSLDN